MNAKIPRMDYRQYRAARRLVHECCNYDGGNCLLLEDGEPCVCVQSISYSLLCPLMKHWKPPSYAGRMKRINATKRKRKQRGKCHALGHFKPA